MCVCVCGTICDYWRGRRGPTTDVLFDCVGMMPVLSVCLFGNAVTPKQMLLLATLCLLTGLVA